MSLNLMTLQAGGLQFYIKEKHKSTEIAPDFKRSGAKVYKKHVSNNVVA